MIQDQNILNHPSVLLSFHIVFSPSFPATFSVFFLVSGVLVPATGLVPQGWKETGKEEEGGLWNKNWRRRKPRSTVPGWGGPGLRRRRRRRRRTGSCGSWFIWLVFFLLPVQVEAHTLFGTCLAGLWAFLPLGILAFMAPKKRKSKVITGKGKGQEEGQGEDQEEEQQQEMGEGEVLEEEELPEKNLTREEPN